MSAENTEEIIEFFDRTVGISMREDVFNPIDVGFDFRNCAESIEDESNY